jgi:hypothetical protein
MINNENNHITRSEVYSDCCSRRDKNRSPDIRRGPHGRDCKVVGFTWRGVLDTTLCDKVCQ